MVRTAVLLLALAALAPLVVAEDACRSDALVDTGVDTPATLTGGQGRYYVVYHDCNLEPGPCLMDLWIYEESNGIDGLQRDDEIRTNPCGLPGDTPVF